MVPKLTNEHLIHTAVNTACIILSLSLFSFNSCCFVGYEADVFIRLSERKSLQLWQVPQSLSHSLFPWQSFRQHHGQTVRKDPYNLFFFFVFFSFPDMQPRSGHQTTTPNSESASIHSLQVPHSLSDAMPTKFHQNKMPLFLNDCYKGAFTVKQPSLDESL